MRKAPGEELRTDRITFGLAKLRPERITFGVENVRAEPIAVDVLPWNRLVLKPAIFAREKLPRLMLERLTKFLGTAPVQFLKFRFHALYCGPQPL